MPIGSLITDEQKSVLDPILKGGGLVATITRDNCSMNMHGELYLHPQRWSDGKKPTEETLLARRDGSSNKGEPPVHFHVDWHVLKWIIIKRLQLPRIKTTYSVALCRSKNAKDTALWFYVNDTNRAVNELVSKGLGKAIPFG